MVSAGAAGGGDDACENVVPARIHAESVSRDAASQEPLIYRDQQQQQQQSSGSNGGLVRMASSSAIRTVHQDVCTCPKPHQLIRNQQHMKRREFGINGQRRKSFGQRIAAKFGLDSIPWKFANNPLTELFTSSHSTVDVAAPDSPPLPPLPASILHQQRYRQQQQQQQQPAVTPNTVSMPDYPYDVEWDAEYWNGCLMGSCNHLDGECDLCHDCAECGLPFDYEEEDEEEVDEDDDVLFENEAAEIHHHHHHHHPARGGQVANMMLPDTVDIPELPPEVNFFSMFNYHKVVYYYLKIDSRHREKQKRNVNKLRYSIERGCRVAAAAAGVLNVVALRESIGIEEGSAAAVCSPSHKLCI